MMPSRGMGAINPSKMPGKKEITRTDDPNKVAMYKRGGKVKRMDEGGEAEEETPFKKISKQVASMNPPKQAEAAPPPPKEAGIKPSNITLNKDYKRVDLQASTGDVNVHKGATASLGADTSISAIGKQRAQPSLDRIHGQYAYAPDANTRYGAKFSASPTGDKRVEFGLTKSWADGGEVWDKPNPKKKHKKLSPEKKAKAKAAAKAAGRPYPNLIDNMRAAK